MDIAKKSEISRFVWEAVIFPNIEPTALSYRLHVLRIGLLGTPLLGIGTLRISYRTLLESRREDGRKRKEKEGG